MLTKKEAELLKKLIEAERYYFRRQFNGKPGEYVSSDERLIEVGVDLNKTEKRPWMDAAEKLVGAGIAEWAYPMAGDDPPIMLRLASDGKHRIEEED